MNALSFKTTLDGDTLTAIVPDFREDIEGEADLSEEVLRIYGYEHIKSTCLLYTSHWRRDAPRHRSPIG